MSLIAIGLNSLLAVLLLAALAMGWRLNKRLIVLRDSHDGFTRAVADLDAAAQRAEQGLADLRAATDEASEFLADRIEKARELAQRLDRPGGRAGAETPAAKAEARDQDLELDRPITANRLGAMIGAARAASGGAPRLTIQPPPRRDPPVQRARMPDEDLFDEPVGRMPISAMLGARR